MNFNEIYSAASSLKTISSFINDGGIYTILDALGDVEYNAAKMAVRNVNKSSNPKREVELAIGHLQSAHIAFKKIHSPSFEGRKMVTQGAVFNAAYKDVFATALMVLCYLYLGESRLVKDSLRLMLNANRIPDSIEGVEEVAGIFASMLNPSQWQYLVKNQKFDFSHSQVEEFAKKIESLL